VSPSKSSCWRFLVHSISHDAEYACALMSLSLQSVPEEDRNAFDARLFQKEPSRLSGPHV